MNPTLKNGQKPKPIWTSACTETLSSQLDTNLNFNNKLLIKIKRSDTLLDKNR